MSIAEHHARVNVDPYLLAGPYPRAMPAAAALQKSSVSIAAASNTGAIARQLDLKLYGSPTTRWIADPATLVDNGDGTVDWHSSTGSNRAPVWRFDAASQPRVDSAYSYVRPDGTVMSFPAFILDGGMWARLINFPTDIAGFTVSIVAKIRGANGGAYADIFASKFTTTDGDTGADSAVQYRHGGIRTIKRGYTLLDPITQTGRPLILVSRAGPQHCYQFIGDNNWSYTRFQHDVVSHYDMGWYLGRASDSYDNRLTLKADIIEICLWKNAMAEAWMDRHIGFQLNWLYKVVK